VGVGYDSHRFEPGGPLILGGVHIAVDFSLHGHSDGDAVAHAVTDAVLGAAALGDIGAMFPDTDPANRGANSILMLQEAVTRVAEAGWSVGNVDVTVMTESPKLSPYREDMRVKLAEALSVDVSRVSVKAKSNEGMGFVGRGEGLACIAVALLVARQSD
jgi:2-C-methyl-D-erythritol 2,4-cyclodiphosphate synthase